MEVKLRGLDRYEVEAILVHRPQEYTVMTGECPGGLRVFNGHELSVHIRLLLRRTPVQ